MKTWKLPIFMVVNTLYIVAKLGFLDMQNEELKELENLIEWLAKDE